MAFSTDSEDTATMLDQVAAGNPTALARLLAAAPPIPEESYRNADGTRTAKSRRRV